MCVCNHEFESVYLQLIKSETHLHENLEIFSKIIYNKIKENSYYTCMNILIIRCTFFFLIRWEKDEGSIPQFEGITTRLLDDYTSQLYIEKISSRHNGEYTCLASNRAATRKSSAKLTVQGMWWDWVVIVWDQTTMWLMPFVRIMQIRELYRLFYEN